MKIMFSSTKSFFDFLEHEAGPIALIVLAWPITAFVMTQCRLCALTNL